jgi:aldose 1-epimerase
MNCQVRQETRPATNGVDPTVYVLEGADGSRAEVWPAFGCNCYCWRVPWRNGLLDLLYAAPTLYSDARPTRSGVPVLFPFPNRIRAGRFQWDGKEYQLPTNDPSGKNAIHGFACRHPWRVLDQGADEGSAWLQAEFQGSRDAPESLALWPADYRIRLTFRLGPRSLRLEAVVDNPGDRPLPFGLGYHPYFRVPLVPSSEDRHCSVEIHARQYWELVETLPTGKLLPVDAAHDLLQPRPYTELKLDDLLRAEPADGDWLPQGRLLQMPEGVSLRVSASPAFREVVVFTPPHRQAFCIEPYTCITDAINLQQQGVDAGLQVLPPGQQWAGAVVFEASEAP